MQKENLSKAAIDAFRGNYEQLVSGVTGLVGPSLTFVCTAYHPRHLVMNMPARSQVPEKDIEAVLELPRLSEMKNSKMVDVKVAIASDGLSDQANAEI